MKTFWILIATLTLYFIGIYVGVLLDKLGVFAII